MTATSWFQLLASVAMSAAAQITMKIGMSHRGAPRTDGSVIATILEALTNVWVLGGLLLYGASAMVWLLVLSKVEVSFAYPFIAVGMVLVAIVSWLVLGEGLSVARWSGIACICLGVVLLSRT